LRLRRLHGAGEYGPAHLRAGKCSSRRGVQGVGLVTRLPPGFPKTQAPPVHTRTSRGPDWPRHFRSTSPSWASVRLMPPRRRVGKAPGGVGQRNLLSHLPSALTLRLGCRNPTISWPRFCPGFWTLSSAFKHGRPEPRLLAAIHPTTSNRQHGNSNANTGTPDPRQRNHAVNAAVPCSSSCVPVLHVASFPVSAHQSSGDCLLVPRSNNREMLFIRTRPDFDSLPCSWATSA
jgi:hypothetical protein